MFERVKDYFFRRLIKVGAKESNLNKYYDINAINRDIAIYEGVPEWSEDGNINLNLGAAVASELARKATIEFNSNVDRDNGYEYIDEQYQRLVVRTREIVEKLMVQGNIILKPYVDLSMNRIAIEAVNSRNFIPLKFNSMGEMIAVSFIEIAKVKDRYYTKLETHELNEESSVYTVTNKAYNGEGLKSNGDTGEEVKLGVVSEWSNLEPYVELVGIHKPLFAHMKTPYANNEDIDSPLGVSVFSKIRKQLIDFDSVYSDFIHDVNFKRAKIFVPHRYLIDPEKLYGLANEDIFSKLSVEESPNGDSGRMMIDVFNPEIRVEQYSKSMEVILRKIEFNSGLAYGDLSDASVIDKTATEVKASKERSWSTTVDIQKQIENAYRNVIEILVIYSELYSLAKVSSKNSDYEVSFQFDDSIIIDGDQERKILLEEAKLGLISNKEYLIRRYGVTEEEALMMMNDISPKSAKDKANTGDKVGSEGELS